MGLTFANKVTICRIITVPIFILTLAYYSPEREYLRQVGVGIFFLAVLSDVIDGYIARTRYQKTKAGSLLDPLADKFLLISAFVCLYKIEGLSGDILLPLWFIVTVISRDVILLLGSMIIYLVQGCLDIEPSRWGKVTTFFQILCVFGVLLRIEAFHVLWYVTAIITAISGIGYIREGIKVLNASSNQNHS